MFTKYASIWALASTAFAAPLACDADSPLVTVTTPSPGKSGAVWITPHEQYSSSVGVLGCKINHNRVAYWPLYPDVNRYCVKVTRKGRSLHLLHIDQSGGANDISYDAWNYLATGKSAKDAPHCGGALEAQFEWVDNKECADLILSGDGRLPLAASNPDLAPYAPEPKEKYVKLYNLKDMQCQIGKDEESVCPSGLGNVNDPSGIVFEDIKYDTARAGGCPQLSPTD
ncbi:hypothetical protein K458DRAFT_447194 [Lentithecium fluviatile CBS 122367]|uniref:Lytic polysaccharide monooxygenase n=1 Tax=Lentithecium fluviatile CBS 122367 TaxID=1168545 RepID=A0A6G1IFS8_9PLEO|nr:hypothetical protein K458DRAFT_447194 [Lentithecium fluviatile CBS 122367]